MREIKIDSRVQMLRHVAQVLCVLGLPVQMIEFKVLRAAAMTKNQTSGVLLCLFAEDGTSYKSFEK